jgi:hypothetical protein
MATIKKHLETGISTYMMTEKQLMIIMRFQLKNFSGETSAISDDTVHREILNENEWFGHINSIQLYKNVIRYTIKNQGHDLKIWPEEWLSMSIKELAPLII